MNLFEKKEFFSHSGDLLDWKIECDALTDEDIETLAYLISKKYTFRRVYGLPTGGVRLGIALQKYTDENSEVSLIVDDVLTTGKSMEDHRHNVWAEALSDNEEVAGVVIFARKECPYWVVPIFQLHDWFRDE
jgi:orotate phosphoribosyltransferase